jgi:hypothetical protein
VTGARRGAAIGAAAVIFLVLATANSGGYRFGVSDQAYYAPAVSRALDPTLFPHDAPMLDVQSHFLLFDDVAAGVMRTTGASMPTVFLVFYVVTLVALFAASLALARALRFSPWAAAVFVLLMTLRHRITKTGANSLEGYAHPRMFAFACGVAALAAAMRGRWLWAFVAILISATMHPTTTMFFAIALGVIAAVERPEWRRALVGGVVFLALAGAWIVWIGPLAGRLRLMDTAWVHVLDDKDYVFPGTWPWYAWVLNLLYPVAIVWIHRVRVRAGVAQPGERGLVAAMVVLVAIFLISVPLSAVRLALAVQLQVSRVFWLTDAVAAAYVAWTLVDSSDRTRAEAWRWSAIGAVLLASVLRGYDVVHIETRRPLFETTLPPSPWIDAMSWLRAQPDRAFVLADPGHAWKYGSSVRVAADRDVLVEAGKDTSIAMYDRDVALAVSDRLSALAAFDRLTAADARALAARYGVDTLVETVDHPVDLPVRYRNAGFVVYAIR